MHIMTTPISLTPWQKKQAAILYHVTSLDYLIGLKQRLNSIIAFIDPTLDLAVAEGRDRFLISQRWGERDMSQNWANNARPFLADFQLRTAKNIANRAFEIYETTGAYQCGRGMSEYSMQWSTPDEQEKFDTMFAELSDYAGRIDETTYKCVPGSRWHDYAFARTWHDLKEHFTRLPKFRVRMDVEAETGKVPVRTGVYLPQGDPNGSLQFAWTGGEGGVLQECATFNELGLAALRAVGRRDLWRDGDKMLSFLRASRSNSSLLDDPFYEDAHNAEVAGAFIALHSFTSHPCKWLYVELVNGEFEDIDENPMPATHDTRIRVESGQPCPASGYFSSPANQGRRQFFKQGEMMPDVGDKIWATIWQWNEQQ